MKTNQSLEEKIGEIKQKFQGVDLTTYLEKADNEYDLTVTINNPVDVQLIENQDYQVVVVMTDNACWNTYPGSRSGIEDTRQITYIVKDKKTGEVKIKNLPKITIRGSAGREDEDKFELYGYSYVSAEFVPNRPTDLVFRWVNDKSEVSKNYNNLCTKVVSLVRK